MKRKKSRITIFQGSSTTFIYRPDQILNILIAIKEVSKYLKHLLGLWKSQAKNIFVQSLQSARMQS